MKILMLEDSKNDVVLIKRAVLKAFPDTLFTIASSEEEFIERLSWASYDIILSDYHLPTYNGLRALLHVRENHPYLPFVFVTGTLNSEERSANAILQGANGFVLKDDLDKLANTMQAAMDQKAVDKARAEANDARRIKRKLELQRAISLLTDAPDFDNKSAVTEAIELALDHV